MPKVKGWPDFVKVKPVAGGHSKRKFEEIDQPNYSSECDKFLALPRRLPLSSERSRNDNPLEKHSTFNVIGDLGFKFEEILNQVEKSDHEITLSFDTDWPSAYRPTIARTSNIHVCYGEQSCCYFDISGLTRIPFVLIALLKHPKVKLIGNNLKNDIKRFSADFKCDTQSVLNNIKESTDETSDLKLSCEHGWKLNPKSGDVSLENIQAPVERDIVFQGRIEYCTNFAECAAFSYDLLKEADKSQLLILGFDLEWPFSRLGSGKTALMQICPNDSICYIFHVFHFDKLPEALVRLLSHEKVRLTGLNIINDLRKLGRDFRIKHIGDVIKNNMIELSTFANRHLNTSRQWSLKWLCRHQLGYNLDKGPRSSNWGRIDLSQTQLLYAATDAYVSAFENEAACALKLLVDMACKVGVLKLNKVRYVRALELQSVFSSIVKNKTSPWNGGVVLLLEHPPVYTVGIRNKDYGETVQRELINKGAEFHTTDRGGLITFHGPGQLIAYPILDLKMWNPSVRWYVDRLEETVIRACSSLSIQAHRLSPYPGIWVGNRKICAVGIRASRFVTSHGIGLNVNVNLDWFNHIVPCGIEDKGVTSISNELNRNVTTDDVIPILMESFGRSFSCDLIDIN